MKMLTKIPLLVWIIIAILTGVLIGALTPGFIGGINSVLKTSIPTDVVVQIFVSFSTIFSAFLSFAIPLIIIGFIVPGISSLAQGAGNGDHSSTLVYFEYYRGVYCPCCGYAPVPHTA